jgi:hypothetical protein
MFDCAQILLECCGYSSAYSQLGGKNAINISDGCPSTATSNLENLCKFPLTYFPRPKLDRGDSPPIFIPVAILTLPGPCAPACPIFLGCSSGGLHLSPYQIRRLLTIPELPSASASTYSTFLGGGSEMHGTLFPSQGRRRD